MRLEYPGRVYEHWPEHRPTQPQAGAAVADHLRGNAATPAHAIVLRLVCAAVLWGVPKVVVIARVKLSVLSHESGIQEIEDDAERDQQDLKETTACGRGMKARGRRQAGPAHGSPQPHVRALVCCGVPRPPAQQRAPPRQGTAHHSASAPNTPQHTRAHLYTAAHQSTPLHRSTPKRNTPKHSTPTEAEQSRAEHALSRSFLRNGRSQPGGPHPKPADASTALPRRPACRPFVGPPVDGILRCAARLAGHGAQWSAQNRGRLRRWDKSSDGDGPPIFDVP